MSIKEFADDLQVEVVSDMANSFFGARKEVEDSLAAFTGMVKDFLPTVELMFQAASTLRLLLLDDQAVTDFATALGVDPADILSAEGAPIRVYETIPFAWTKCGRYVRCVLLAYDALHAAVDVYLHGRYYNDPERPGRKRLTIHYLRLEEIAHLINEKIEKVNGSMSTTAMLRTVKSMSPDQSEREDIMGDLSLMDGSNLDKDMCFIPLDFEGYDFPRVKELPSPDTVRDVISRFAKALFATRSTEAQRAMDSLQGR